MLPNLLQAMRGIERCRTIALGGQVYSCPECEEVQCQYHSCRNRHCLKCQGRKGEEWLEKQQDNLVYPRHTLWSRKHDPILQAPLLICSRDGRAIDRELESSCWSKRYYLSAR